MNAISSVGLIDRIGASRAAVQAASASALRAGAASMPSTRVTLGPGVSDAAVYDRPVTTSVMPRVWSSPAQQDDAISALMSRNRQLMAQDSRPHAYGPNEQWRGLGGALLKYFGETGKDYSQTVADDLITWRSTLPGQDIAAALSPEEQAQRAAEIVAAQSAALDSVTAIAAKADLTIRLNSGASVTLRIAASAGFSGVMGEHVELTSSGAISDAERAAVAKLAAGLDSALEGLGSGDAASVDLSGLTGYDRNVIAGLDLVANNAMGGQPLDSFSLHLGQGQQSVALKGRDGEMQLTVDPGTVAGGASGPQRQSAMQQMLRRLDSAGERGHVNDALLQQMKSAFQQLQDAVAASGDAATGNGTGALADFDASFSGTSLRSNADGTMNEVAFTRYQLSQNTMKTNDARRGAPSTVQTLSEQLTADFHKAPPGRMLDASRGAYTHTQIAHSSTVKTLIGAASAGEPAYVLRRTTEQQLKTVTNLQGQRVLSQQSVPTQRSVLERLQPQAA